MPFHRIVHFNNEQQLAADVTTSLKDISTDVRKNIEKKPLWWAAIAVAAVGGVIVAQQVLATPESRSKRVRNELKRHIADLDTIGSSVLESGRRGKRYARKELEALADSVQHELPNRQKRSLISKIGNHESAVAAFCATLLAKGVSSYYEWRSMEQAQVQGRRQGIAISASGVRATEMTSISNPSELTVAELRSVASDLEIDGRSSMNKSELVAAVARHQTVG